MILRRIFENQQSGDELKDSEVYKYLVVKN